MSQLSQPRPPVFEVYGSRSSDGRFNVGTKMNGVPTDLTLVDGDENAVREFIEQVVVKYGTSVTLTGDVAELYNADANSDTN